MNSVRTIIRKKTQRGLPTADPNATVLNSLQELAELDVGALLVIKNEKILGIFSERDYARKIFLEGRTSPLTLVKDVMTKKVSFVGLDNTIEECMYIMIEKGVRHLSVMNNGELVDFISMRDVVESIVDGKDFLINQLTQYITGSQSKQKKFLKKNLVTKSNLTQLNQMIL